MTDKEVINIVKNAIVPTVSNMLGRLLAAQRDNKYNLEQLVTFISDLKSLMDDPATVNIMLNATMYETISAAMAKDRTIN